MPLQQFLKDLRIIPQRFEILMTYSDCSVWEEKELVSIDHTKEQSDGYYLIYETIERGYCFNRIKSTGKHTFSLDFIYEGLDSGIVRLITDNRIWWRGYDTMSTIT